MGFSRQEYWSGLPLPSPGDPHFQNPELSLGLTGRAGEQLAGKNNAFYLNRFQLVETYVTFGHNWPTEMQTLPQSCYSLQLQISRSRTGRDLETHPLSRPRVVQTWTPRPPTRR